MTQLIKDLCLDCFDYMKCVPTPWSMETCTNLENDKFHMCVCKYVMCKLLTVHLTVILTGMSMSLKWCFSDLYSSASFTKPYPQECH